MATGEIGQALASLFSPHQVVEVRAITEEGIASGYFSDHGLLVETAEASMHRVLRAFMSP